LIRVDVTTAIFLYLMSSLCVVFFLWIFFERKAILPKYVREEADVWECAICTYIYVDSTHHEISQCPQCKSYNKKALEDRLI
jgi:hypothetical protein